MGTSGTKSGSLRPLVLRPWCVAVHAGMVAALAIAGIIRGVRARRANDPKRLARLARKKALNDWLVRDDIARGKNIVFVDLWDVSLGADGQPRPELYVADRLSPNAEPFQLRAELIRPAIE